MCHSSTSTASPMLSYLVCAMGHLHLNKLNEYYPSSRINHEYDFQVTIYYASTFRKTNQLLQFSVSYGFDHFHILVAKNTSHSKGSFFNSLSKLCKIMGEVLSLPQIIDYSHNNQVETNDIICEETECRQVQHELLGPLNVS